MFMRVNINYVNMKKTYFADFWRDDYLPDVGGIKHFTSEMLVNFYQTTIRKEAIFNKNDT
jgi:hypothetical protein